LLLEPCINDILFTETGNENEIILESQQQLNSELVHILVLSLLITVCVFVCCADYLLNGLDSSSRFASCCVVWELAILALCSLISNLNFSSLKRVRHGLGISLTL
jgi:Na+-transporting NADH:ubiquinone oxidoreductase subunit NqrE